MNEKEIMKVQFILVSFSVLFLQSCGQTNRLSDEDYMWMPYNGGETLVFKSNTGEADSFFVLERDTLLAYPEAQAFNGVKNEALAVHCSHNSRNIEDVERSYCFFKVQKTKAGQTELVFDLSTNAATFYRILPVKIDSLSELNPVSLKTANGQYNDIHIIYPDRYAKDFYYRSNFVTKLYWSKSKGLIRYDKRDGVYWELSK